MRRAFYQIIPWAIILLPFLVLGISYTSLPAEITIFRGFDAASAEYAPKSLFTVFRVPMIEVVCALAIEIMRRRAAGVDSQKSYYLMWTILLYTVAFKTLLQAFEMVSSKDKSDIFFYTTLGVVIVGIISAAFAGRKAFSGFKRGEWKLEHWEKAALAGLLAGYVILAFGPDFFR
jgi:hypothetical protein